MRELTTAEKFSQMITGEKLRAGFMIHNTNTFPEYEQAGAGFEIGQVGLDFANDPWMPVFPIRYGGSMGLPNVWGL